MTHSDLVDELLLIQDDKLRSVVSTYLKDYVPDYFWSVPASSTGKYHPEIELGEGGLVRHTKRTIMIASDLLKLEQYGYLQPMSDIIITSLLLHDTFKYGLDRIPTAHSAYSVHEHPIIAADEFIKVADVLDYNDKYTVSSIKKCIQTHMGQWVESKHSNIVLQKPKSKVQQFVHLCDYIASRKW